MTDSTLVTLGAVAIAVAAFCVRRPHEMADWLNFGKRITRESVEADELLLARVVTGATFGGGWALLASGLLTLDWTVHLAVVCAIVGGIAGLWYAMFFDAFG
ncbi:hypothetical protein [Halovivax sp.]|uniref:hypothetical protein n=1 Tax=Halovivax sp. TaxID=1935978 RepID=UPI0025C6BB8B|nr:hypothetical protein [Halovivax sp.]